MFLTIDSAFAQMPAYKDVGRVPPAMRTAKAIFVSNAGSDSGLFPQPFSGDPDRPYTEFFTALEAKGVYVLADDPAR